MPYMAAAEITPKSPLSPFSKGGIFSDATLTPLWKRGKGEIFDSSGAAGHEFQTHHTSKSKNNSGVIASRWQTVKGRYFRKLMPV
jgi:hypothetical protein